MNTLVKEIISLPVFRGSLTLLSRDVGLSKGTLDTERMTVRTRKALIGFLEGRVSDLEKTTSDIRLLINNLKQI